MIHTNAKDVVTRLEALRYAFGYQGGTIHQMAEMTGCSANDLIYAENVYNNDNAAGWYAYRTCGLEYNQTVAYPKYKGNLQFWLGVASGVQTALKFKEVPEKKF